MTSKLQNCSKLFCCSKPRQQEKQGFRYHLATLTLRWHHSSHSPPMLLLPLTWPRTPLLSRSILTFSPVSRTPLRGQWDQQTIRFWPTARVALGGEGSTGPWPGEMAALSRGQRKQQTTPTACTRFTKCSTLSGPTWHIETSAFCPSSSSMW